MSTPLARAVAPSRLSAAVAALLLPLAAHAARPEQPAADTPSALDSVVIVGVRPVSPLTFETDPHQPRQPVPASDGADYLKTIPGFTAIRNGGTNGDPVLRGMFGSRLNLLTNEGAMPGACPGRMDNPLSYVAPETYDRLVVVKGPQTVLWGPGASAGTVRFSRDREVFADPVFKGSASALAGSNGRNDQTVDGTYGRAPGYARLTAHRSESGDYRDGDGRVVPSRWNKWNTDAALGWTPDADTLIRASIGAGDAQARYAGRGMDGARFRRDSQGLRVERTNLPGALEKVEANAYRNRADHVMDNYTLRTPNPMGAMAMPMASNVERLTTGGRAAFTFDFGRFDLTAGVDTQDSRHRSRSATGRGVYATRPWSIDATLGDTGVFAEGTWALDDARIVGGARIDRARARDERARVDSMSTPNPTFGQTRRETLGAGFARYERGGANGLSWFAGLGRTERMPDYWELFSPKRGPTGAPNAFAGIDTEKTTQLDIGARWRTARLDAWISAYAGRIDDYILFAYTRGGMGLTSSARNVDADIHGAEAGVTLRPTMHVKLDANLAWAWGANATDHRPLPQMPPLDARLGLAWDDHDRWSAGLLVRGVARQSRIAPGEGNVTGRDLDASAGFATVAVNASYRVNDVLRLSAGIDNLFDRAFAEHLNLAGSADFGYPADPVRIDEPGRTLWLRAGARW